MSDPKPDADNTAKPEDAAAEPKRNVAKPGQKDAGNTVESAGGELFSGLISDIADGDR